jgi:hypothetical protein
MGKPRKPTKILAINGAMRKNPSRYKDREFEPVTYEPIGEPPAGFSNPDSGMQRELLAIWNEFIARDTECVLTSAFRVHLEMTCRLTYKMRHECASTGELTALNKCLGQLGLTPADRSKVSGNKKRQAREAENSEWGEFQGGRESRAK